MALKTLGAFAAGLGVGWVARSMVGSTREAVVQSIVLAHRVHHVVRRMTAEQMEWVEDMIAEGRARYEAMRDEAPFDAEAPPPVVEVRQRSREKAA